MNDPLDHDPFVVAVVLAIATALASYEDPQLGALSLTLIALAIATRLVHLRTPTRGAHWHREELVGIAIVGLAALLYAVAPPSLGALRGPVLALSLLPLWWARGHPAGDGGALA